MYFVRCPGASIAKELDSVDRFCVAMNHRPDHGFCPWWCRQKEDERKGREKRKKEYRATIFLLAKTLNDSWMIVLSLSFNNSFVDIEDDENQA